MNPSRIPLRIARPTADLAAAERFWRSGLGLEVLYRADASAEGGHALLMLGWPDAAWHLEFVAAPGAARASRQSVEDLLVLYLDGDIDDALVAPLLRSGGRRVTSPNPYWERWGVTVEDPDGYRLTLCTRSWS